LFEVLKSWFDGRRALRELRTTQGKRNTPYLGYFSDQITQAIIAFDGGAHDRAMQVWQEMHRTFPDLTITSAKALNLLIDMRRFDEADALILEGRSRYPRLKAMYAAAFARVAYRRGDLEETLRRCESQRREFPKSADGYMIAANALRDHGRHEEGEAILGRGVLKLPDEMDLRVLYARSAMARRAWPEALPRWMEVRRRFKEHAVGAVGAAECLREMGRYSDAETILNDAHERFEMNPWPIVELANLADARGETDRAVEYWESLIRRLPSFEHAYVMGVAAMRKAGQEDKADELLRRMALRSPGDLGVQLEFARSAERGGDTAEAVRRWARVCEEFPDCDEARVREAEARAAMEGRAAPSDR